MLIQDLRVPDKIRSGTFNRSADNHMANYERFMSEDSTPDVTTAPHVATTITININNNGVSADTPSKITQFGLP